MRILNRDERCCKSINKENKTDESCSQPTLVLDRLEIIQQQANDNKLAIKKKRIQVDRRFLCVSMWPHGSEWSPKAWTCHRQTDVELVSSRAQILHARVSLLCMSNTVASCSVGFHLSACGNNDTFWLHQNMKWGCVSLNTHLCKPWWHSALFSFCSHGVQKEKKKQQIRCCALRFIPWQCQNDNRWRDTCCKQTNLVSRSWFFMSTGRSHTIKIQLGDLHSTLVCAFLISNDKFVLLHVLQSTHCLCATNQRKWNWTATNWRWDCHLSAKSVLISTWDCQTRFSHNIVVFWLSVSFFVSKGGCCCQDQDIWLTKQLNKWRDNWLSWTKWHWLRSVSSFAKNLPLPLLSCAHEPFSMHACGKRAFLMSKWSALL